MSTDTAYDETATAEVVAYTGTATEEYRPRIVMAPEEAKALDDALRANMLAVLRKDVDYGIIPGTGSKASLLKPGAEKLLQWFGFGHTMERGKVERTEDGHRLGVTYKCTVSKGMPSGRREIVATCDGYAGYDEDRFYVSAEQATQKERGNAARYRREVNPAKCAEYRAPWNSVIKMSQKRALVGAALQATSASSLFTQDVEDATPEAVPADPLPVIAGVAAGIIRGLPKETRQAFNRWFPGQGFPRRTSDWSAEQWCAGLVACGRLDIPAETGPADDVSAGDVPTGDVPPSAVTVIPPLGPEDPWTAKIDDIADPEEAAEVAAEFEQLCQAGDIPPAHAAQIRAALTAKTATVTGSAA